MNESFIGLPRSVLFFSTCGWGRFRGVLRHDTSHAVDLSFAEGACASGVLQRLLDKGKVLLENQRHDRKCRIYVMMCRSAVSTFLILNRVLSASSISCPEVPSEQI